ncbi:MAG: hypothetical protein IKW06_06605 [Clostridia bacterium]|nr:hypothetical protein [Clostridia bacterium]
MEKCKFVGRVITILVSLVLVLSLVACGDKSTSDEEILSDLEVVLDSEEEATPVTTNNDENVTENTETAVKTVEWREFLKEYENWVDSYVAILKKYSNNPTDMSILSDYTKMVTELAEWQTRTDDMQQELEEASPAEIAEYSAELLRIAAKIAEAAY